MNILVRFSAGLAARAAAVLFAVGAAQFPLFYGAYENTVAGALHEAQGRYEELQREAQGLQLSVESFIARHESNTDEAFRASGRIHRTTLEHYTRYSAMLEALRAAPVWQRPWTLQQNFDRGLFEATRFAPGLPLTLEAGAYALIGLLLAWLLSATVGHILRPREQTLRI